VTARTNVLQLILTRLDRSLGIGFLRNHVHMIRVMHIWTQVRVGLVVTKRELMLNRALATVRTYRRCNRCRQN